MLSNAYFLAKIGADTAENEQHFAEILPIGRRGVRRGGARHARLRGGAPRGGSAPRCWCPGARGPGPAGPPARHGSSRGPLWKRALQITPSSGIIRGRDLKTQK